MAGKYGQKPSTAAKKSKSGPVAIASEAETVNHGEVEILKWFQSVRFRKVAFAGVDEADLWRKMGELYDLFHQAVSAERARYEGLLQTYAKTTTEKLNALQQQNDALREQYNELYQAYLDQTTGRTPGQGGERHEGTY